MTTRRVRVATGAPCQRCGSGKPTYCRRMCRRCYLRATRSLRSGRACRHCGVERQALRPRGLCWGCYYTPAVSALYPRSLNGRARLGSGLTPPTRGLPPEPTAARPGSPEKIAVLAARVEAGHLLFHPADFTVRGGASWRG